MTGLIIAGDRSGSGKTTVTMALLAALRSRGASVQAFKVGPDYIDPMFHRAITGRPAYNLDPVLTSENYVQQSFLNHAATASYAVVEGVMGLFDGAGGTDWASTAHVARLLGCPIMLVVDCARLSRSLAAVVHGFKTLDPRVEIAGVVLNRVGSDRHLAMLQAAIASVHLPVLGVLRRDDAVTLPDRHLGLVPTDEIADLPKRFQHLADLGRRCFGWPKLEHLLQVKKASNYSVLEPISAYLVAAQNPSDGRSQITFNDATIHSPSRIGIARDRAFSFYYEDNLTALTRLGAELIPFSPLSDPLPPPELDGLYLGGGFPEIFAEELSNNQTMRTAIARHIVAGIPTYAECGGLMYLCRELVDFEGRSWPMVNVLPTITTMTSRLTLGYRQITVKDSTLLATAGEQFWGHEFHRSALSPESSKPSYELRPYTIPDEPKPPPKLEGWQTATVQASYAHLHWGSRPSLPQRFLEHCHRYSAERG